MRFDVNLKLILVSSVLLFFTSLNQVRADATPARYFVKFTASARVAVPEDLVEANERVQGFGITLDRHFPQIDVFVGNASDPAEFAQTLLSKLRQREDIAYVEPLVKIQATLRPNDVFFGKQYGMPRIQAEGAWDFTTGSYEVVVAVSDTGITRGHVDLKNQIWTNEDEIAGNGIDDDGNGFIDDVHGWDFFGNDNDPWDENRPGHGTHVSGIIGAEGNNEDGIAGVAWQVRIMPLRFLGVQGSGTDEGAVSTILYAVDNGARIINASWGAGEESTPLNEAITYMYEKNALLFAAAGNDSDNTDKKPHFPSSTNLPGIVSVASSYDEGTFSGFSNYGEVSVDLAAPGSKILSSTADGQWMELNGTSMAAPMVSGVAALMLSVEPELSALDLRNGILNAVIERRGYSRKLSTAGDLNAKRALEQLGGGFQVWPSRVTVGIGNVFRFTARDNVGAVLWRSSDPSIASIDGDGVLNALKAGEVKISAVDGAGAIAETTWVRVVSRATPGNGCNMMQAHPLTPAESAAAAFNMALPILAGYLMRRRYGSSADSGARRETKQR